mgnify:CR=1 FL=1
MLLDGGDLYVGRRGMKSSTNFLKFTLAPAKYKSVFNIRLKKNKLQQISKRQLQKDIDRGGVLSYVDFKKLYKRDRKSTRLNSSHKPISYAVFCLKKKKK